MCIICYKPQGVKFPSENVLKNCFENNSDGAGYMYAYNHRVFIRKGFMHFEDFMNSLNAERERVGDKVPFVLHFRITTQGGVKKELCHPYPLSKDMKKLKWLNCNCNIGVAHNGIISLTSSRGSYSFNSTTKKYIYSNASVDYNDTMKFITDYLSLIIQDKKYYKNQDTLDLIAKLCESKLAILDSDGHCELIGNGWIKEKGCWFSNSTYQYNNNFVKYGCSYGCTSYYSDDMFDEWEGFYNENTKEYDFDESYCPMSVERESMYCSECANKHSCSLYKMCKKRKE